MIPAYSSGKSTVGPYYPSTASFVSSSANMHTHLRSVLPVPGAEDFSL
jgi:hypothetical protein